MTSLAQEVEKYAGFPYVFGAAGPNSFDCSGLVQYGLTALGYKNVPRTSEAQWAWVTKVSASQIQPGDLVFAQFPGDNQASPGHVGVYIGNGQVFSARSPSAGIGIDSLSSWGSAIVGYGKVPGTGSAEGAGNASATLDSSGGGGVLSDVLGWLTGSSIGDLWGKLGDLLKIFHTLISPSFWVRVAAFLIGAALFAFGVYALTKANSGEPMVKTPDMIPVPV